MSAENIRLLLQGLDASRDESRRASSVESASFLAVAGAWAKLHPDDPVCAAFLHLEPALACLSQDLQRARGVLAEFLVRCARHSVEGVYNS